MKKFVKKITLFLAPIIITVLFLECFVRMMSSNFYSKVNYIKNNPDIELLILGSSHNTTINPKLFNIKTANLAFPMQDIQLDSAIFFNQIKKLKKLKYLILEFDYITLFKKNDDDYFRLSWYYIYYNIQLNNLKGIKKYSLYMSSPQFFNDIIIKKINSFWQKKTINPDAVFKNLNYNEKLIEIETAKRIKKMKKSLSNSNFNFNTSKINYIIDFCNKNNIKVILVSNPVHKTYSSSYENNLIKNRLVYIDSLLKTNKKLIYFNHEFDFNFNTNDFYNADHLNSTGAAKFTKLLNSKIDSIQNFELIH